LLDTDAVSTDSYFAERKNGDPEEDEDESESDADDSESDGDAHPTPFKGARPPGAPLDEDSISENENETTKEKDEDDDFIEEDDVEAVELPEMFSMSRFQDLALQFKTVVQLFVHLACAEGNREQKRRFMTSQVKSEWTLFQRFLAVLISLLDSYFSFPLKAMRRKLEGTKDGIVTSSVWTPVFIKAFNK